MATDSEPCQLSRSFRGCGRSQLGSTAPDLLGGLDWHCIGERNHAILELAGQNLARRTDECCLQEDAVAILASGPGRKKLAHLLFAKGENSFDVGAHEQPVGN